jgi:hypothetical protein
VNCICTAVVVSFNEVHVGNDGLVSPMHMGF